MINKRISLNKLLQGLRVAQEKEGQEKNDVIRALQEYVVEHVELIDKSTPVHLNKTRELLSSLNRGKDFNIGDFVVWKDCLKNKRNPPYNTPVIVAEILTEPLYPFQDAGSAYYREPVDLVIGIIDEDEELVLYHVDSRRFRKFVPAGS